jgi:hypothetical protein
MCSQHVVDLQLQILNDPDAISMRPTGVLHHRIDSIQVIIG